MSINQNKEMLDNNPITNIEKEVFSKVSKYFSNNNVNTNNKNNHRQKHHTDNLYIIYIYFHSGFLPKFQK